MTTESITQSPEEALKEFYATDLTQARIVGYSDGLLGLGTWHEGQIRRLHPAADKHEEVRDLFRDAYLKGFNDGYRAWMLEHGLTPERVAAEKDVDVRTVLRILRDERRQEAIFPLAYSEGAGQRRIWRLNPHDVEYWKPANTKPGIRK